MLPMFLGSVGMPELAVVALILILMFGGRKIPALMSGIGQGIRNFKDGLRGGD